MRTHRTAHIAAQLAERHKARADLAVLARHGSRKLARLLSVPEQIAVEIGSSPRLAARAGQRLRAELGLDVTPEPTGPIATWLDTPGELSAVVAGIGLCVRMGQIAGVLLKPDIEALKRQHGERAVGFAMRHHPDRLRGAGIDLVDLQDAPAVQRQGAAEILAWARAHHGHAALFLEDRLPGTNSPLLQPGETAMLIEAWSSLS